MSEEDDAEKSHEPSQKKLDDARRRGEVAKSADLVTAAGYAGMLGAILLGGAAGLREMGAALATLLSDADRIAAGLGPADGGGARLAGALMVETARALAPWFLLPPACALLCVLGQRALVFSGSKLQPKLSRISITSHAAQKFGPAGLMEFAKSAVKLLLYGVILSLFLAASLPAILALVSVDPGLAMSASLTLVVRFLWLVLAVAVAIGVLDVFWQHHHHRQKNRMSRKEMTDEHKEAEGDPHFKAQRRQRGQEIALNRMLAAVPEASVVVVNPTHYAVALKWDRSSPGAPECVAKGVDHSAARIREKAAEAGVPIHSDPPTARALHAVVEIGEEIRPEHYAAVAVAIRFAEDMKRKARAR